MRRLFALAAVVSVAAGCGSTTVVTRTRVVHPCGSARAMDRCVAETVAVLRRLQGLPTDGIKASCAAEGSLWLCTVALRDESGGTLCVDSRLRVTRTDGVPVLFDSSENLDGGCAGMVQ